jgi:uncharacterized protein YoxC
MHIHIHIHHYEGLSSLERKVDHIMATQAQLAQDLNDLKASMDAVSTEIDKVSTETSTLLTKIADLETQIGNAGNTSPEVDGHCLICGQDMAEFRFSRRSSHAAIDS